MVIVYDVATKVNNRVRTIDTFDTGFNRNAAGQLKIEGFEYYAEYSSCARLLAMAAYGLGRDWRECKPSVTQIVTIASIIRPTFDPLIRKICGPNGKKLAKSALTAPLTLLRAVEPDSADLFLDDYMDMVNLKKGSPIIALRKFFDRPGKPMGGTQAQTHGFMGTTSALWYYVNEKPVESIRGNQEHIEWLLNTSKNLVKRIRDSIGADLTIAGLEAKG
jgi:hypothetical protein